MQDNPGMSEKEFENKILIELGEQINPDAMMESQMRLN
jgi:hypothetical protein